MKYNIVVLKERMENEGRVALTPLQCSMLTDLGHSVYVEYDAGEKSGYDNLDYWASGAISLQLNPRIIPLLQSQNTVMLKVKQPIPEDDVWLEKMKDGILLTFFHSTGEEDRRTLDILLKNNVTAISYELIQTEDGIYPILIPMSEIAGRLAVKWGLDCLQKQECFSKRGNQYLYATIFGLGTVGFSAVKEALKLEFSRITVFEQDFKKYQFLCKHLTASEICRVDFFLTGSAYYETVLKRGLKNADLLVGAVLVPGGHAPIAVSEERLKLMSKWAVIVDVACDQGGCIWHPENETAPVFEFEGKTFYRVPNMPGSVPHESSPILAKAIFPYLLAILGERVPTSLRNNIPLQRGLLTHEGKVMNEKAALYWGEKYTDPATVFGS